MNKIIKVRKKGKTRGRPSKKEKAMESILVFYLEQPEIKKAIREELLNRILYREQRDWVDWKVVDMNE